METNKEDATYCVSTIVLLSAGVAGDNRISMRDEDVPQSVGLSPLSMWLCLTQIFGKGLKEEDL